MSFEDEHRERVDHRGTRARWWWKISPANPAFREKVESYGLSVAFHVGLLLLLGLVTLGGGGGKGDRVGEGAQGTIAQSSDPSAFSAEALEEILEKEKVKPLEAELPRPRDRTERRLTEIVRTAPTRQFSAEGMGGGHGGGIGAGIGKDFGDFLGLLRRSGFDAVFVIDATGSMKYVIEPVRRKITRLVTTIQRLVPVARVGLVLYRDEGEDWVVRKSDLTFHGSKLESFLTGMDVTGGGKWEEDVRAGLRTAIQEMSWRSRSKKVIILVASSPPYEEHWPEIDSLTRTFRNRGGVISAVDLSEPAHEEFERQLHRSIYGTEPETISPLPEFYKQTQEAMRRISKQADGELVALEDYDALVQQLLVVAFGKEWEAKVAEYAEGL